MSNITEKDAYVVLGYACNHRCSCCPCGQEQGENAFYSREKLMADAEKICGLGITDVTISGGEPTIHPDFLSLLEYCLKQGINVHLLTNGDRFSDRTFADRFLEIAKNRTDARRGSVSVTTTFHSHIPSEHEAQNGVSGSFHRSLEGLRYLDRQGINVAVKHCITRYNYRDLKEYLRFVTDSFSENAEIQLWGIDLSGIDRETAENMFVSFGELGPVLGAALKDFEERWGDSRLLNINNIPLCSCSCYYWKYFSRPISQGYIDYTRTNLSESETELQRNSGPLSSRCRTCPLADQCQGVYESVIRIFGDDVVQNLEEIALQAKLPAVYPQYTSENLNRLYFSPYLVSELTVKGLTIFNRLTGQSVNLRMSMPDILQLKNMFCDGVTFEEAAAKMAEMPGIADPVYTLEIMLARGIIE